MIRAILFFSLGYLTGPIFMPMFEGKPQVVLVVAGMAGTLGIFLILIALLVARLLDWLLRKAPVYDDHP